MKPFVFHLPGDERFAGALAREMGAERAALPVHRFADGESLVRLDADVTGRDFVLAVVDSFVVGRSGDPAHRHRPKRFTSRGGEDRHLLRIGPRRDGCRQTRRSARWQCCLGAELVTVQHVDPAERSGRKTADKTLAVNGKSTTDSAPLLDQTGVLASGNKARCK